MTSYDTLSGPVGPARPFVLASRWARAAAAFYDAAVLTLAVALLFLLLGYWGNGARTRPDTVVSVVIAWIVFLALNGYLLAKNGQTMGKMVTNTKIVAAETGEPVSLWRLVILRYGIPGLVSLLPAVGPLFSLIDVAFILRRDRRCMHDFIAGTKVVSLPARESQDL